MTYDPRRVRRLYERHGEAEFRHHDARASTRISSHMHQRFLAEHVRSGDRVLEVGAGAGRFTMELARLGARITVTDISEAQLERNAKYAAEAGLETFVEDRLLLDAVHLDSLSDDSFDAVVVFGGVLSHVQEKGDQALAEFLRVVRPGGLLLIDAFSRWGSIRAFLPELFDLAADAGMDKLAQAAENGWCPGELSSIGAYQAYTAAELQALLTARGLAVIDMAASNVLSVRNDESLARVMADDALWPRFLSWEEAACRAAGALDGGHYVIAAARTPERPQT